MEVHVPQARNQEFARGIDDAGVGSGLDAWPNGDDTPVADRDVLARQRAGSVDDRGMLDDDILSKDGWKEDSESEQPPGEQSILTCLFQISCSVSG
jgi:hypothetical protein